MASVASAPPIHRVPQRAVRLAVAALLAAAVLPAPRAAAAQAARYELDPVHTRVLFELSHAGYSQAMGTISGSTGTLVFDPADWSSAKVDVSIPVAKLDLGDAAWSRAALARGMLDGARHPVATFASTRVEPVDGTHARVVGMLTLRGVAREVVLDVALNKLGRYPLPPFRRTVGFSARTTLSRAAFGADAWSSLVGDEVVVRIEAEARRARAGHDPAPDARPDVDPAPATPGAATPDAATPDAPTPDAATPASSTP